MPISQCITACIAVSHGLWPSICCTTTDLRIAATCHTIISTVEVAVGPETWATKLSISALAYPRMLLHYSLATTFTVIIYCELCWLDCPSNSFTTPVPSERQRTPSNNLLLQLCQSMPLSLCKAVDAGGVVNSFWNTTNRKISTSAMIVRAEGMTYLTLFLFPTLNKVSFWLTKMHPKIWQDHPKNLSFWTNQWYYRVFF